jgi:excisionase family DNA binding protein
MNSPRLPDWLPRRMMTVDEVAEVISQSPRQVRRLVADGRLNVVRIGRSVRVTPEAVVALLGSHMTRDASG